MWAYVAGPYFGTYWGDQKQPHPRSAPVSTQEPRTALFLRCALPLLSPSPTAGEWLGSRKRVLPPQRGRRPPVALVLEPSPTALLNDARGRLASLASTDQMEPTERPEKCPNGSGRVVVELYSGMVYPDRCRSSQCDYCLPLNARRRCLAITYAGPQRMIRLSLLAGESDDSPCRTALTRVGLIRRNLKRIGRNPGEWSFTIERNPNGTGYHAHCLQRGPSIPQAELQESCVRAGAGFPHINSIKRHGIWTSRYGLKGFGADGYGLKSFRPNGNAREALRINGGRLEHHSRSFFSVDGEALRVRDMERAAIAAMNGLKRVAYVGCTEDRAQSMVHNERLRHALIAQVNRRTVMGQRAMS